MSGFCAFCSKDLECILQCSRCKSVAYCDSTCQKSHWSQHKSICRHRINLRQKINTYPPAYILISIYKYIYHTDLKDKKYAWSFTPYGAALNIWKLYQHYNHYTITITEEELLAYPKPPIAVKVEYDTRLIDYQIDLQSNDCVCVKLICSDIERIFYVFTPSFKESMCFGWQNEMK